jgi:hypothetical protein
LIKTRNDKGEVLMGYEIIEGFHSKEEIEARWTKTGNHQIMYEIYPREDQLIEHPQFLLTSEQSVHSWIQEVEELERRTIWDAENKMENLFICKGRGTGKDLPFDQSLHPGKNGGERGRKNVQHRFYVWGRNRGWE